MSNIAELLHIMKCLRDTKKGCPWDIEQNFHSIAPYTVEEAYEVADAIERNDMEDLRDELGDLLFQVVFHSQMADEQSLFHFEDVVKAVSEKLVRRHPHVFADVKIESAAEQTVAWENHKEQERQNSDKYQSVLDGIAKSLPGMTRAAKLQKRAAKVGFDWDAIEPILEKLNEEIEEFQVELNLEAGHERMENEIGDILFTVVNIARHAQIDPELAIRRANGKFEKRFRAMEEAINLAGETMRDLSIDRMEHYWTQVKCEEK